MSEPTIQDVIAYCESFNMHGYVAAIKAHVDRLEESEKARREFSNSWDDMVNQRDSAVRRLGTAVALINAAMRRQSAAIDTQAASAFLEECAGGVERQEIKSGG